MGSQAERAARNEAMFREVNEGIEDAAASLATWHADFLCECHDLSCTDMISLTLPEYAATRDRGDRFVVVPGHEEEAIELVVQANERFAVVEKIGEGADVARRLDARAS